MKKNLLFSAAFLLLGGFAFAQNGVHLQMKNSSTGRGPAGDQNISGNTDLYYSPDGFRAESKSNLPNGHSMSMINLRQSSNPNISIMIDETNKTYTEVDQTKAVKTTDTSQYKVSVVGTETVGGYSCKHVLITDKWGSMDEWLTTSIAYEQFSSYFNSSTNTMSDAKVKALKDAGVEGFPVKIQRKSGNSTTTMELVSYEKKNLDASLFQVPAGYTKKDLPAGMAPGSKSPKDMTPEERQKFMEELMKQMQQKPANGGN